MDLLITDYVAAQVLEKSTRAILIHIYGLANQPIYVSRNNQTFSKQIEEERIPHFEETGLSQGLSDVAHHTRRLDVTQI